MTTANDNAPTWKLGHPSPANLPSAPETRAMMVETVHDLWGEKAVSEIDELFEAFPVPPR